MKAKSHGHRVVLVTATHGEAGEIYNMDEAASRPRLGEIRAKELKTASDILGVDRQEFLGYRDSGMVDTADNKDPRSFHQAKLDDAAGKLAVFIREERPDVVVTYAEDGVYGHPDHIKAHYVTNAALDLLEKEGLAVKKQYYTAIPRSMMEAFIQQMPEEARAAMGGNMRVAGTPDELVTTRVDVHDYVERKREASEPTRVRTTRTHGSRPCRTRSTRWRSAPSTTSWSGASRARSCPSQTCLRGLLLKAGQALIRGTGVLPVKN